MSTGVGTITVSGNLSQIPGTQTFGPFSQLFTTGVGQMSVVSLSSGNNTITIPTGTTRVMVVGPNMTTPIPNPSYAGTLTLKGVNGDTGIGFSAGSFASWGYDSTVVAPASFVINASVATTVEVWCW